MTGQSYLRSKFQIYTITDVIYLLLLLIQARMSLFIYFIRERVCAVVEENKLSTAINGGDQAF